jgi:hypothetical protein
MKKAALGIIFLLLTTIIGVIGHSYFEKPFEILISPNGKYKVELYGDKRRPWFFTNTVSAKIFDGQKLLAEQELHHGDWMDNSFESLYQKNVWVDDNIISFRGIQNHKVANVENGDSLVIKNNTEREIRFLELAFSVNKFLVINLPPHSSQTIFVNHSKANEYIFATGEFSDGQKITFKGVNFAEKSKKNSSQLFKYCASIENNTILINSIQIEGFETNPEIIIPKAEKCSQEK